MSAKSPDLSNRIAAEIAATGPISFARFMEFALYDSAEGYYASGRARIGREGDFYTNISVGPLFGQLLAGQFREMWETLGSPQEFSLIEQGAHTGQFAADVLASIPSEFPLKYIIVEPSAALRTRQETTLAAVRDQVTWVENLEAIPPCEGVHFSNELIDAFPFHLLQSEGGIWQELRVDRKDEGFVFQPSAPALDISALPARPDGTMIELRPAVSPWTESLARTLRRGYGLIVDYGFPQAELWAPHRRDGTFTCYQNHRKDALPLENPGEKDITAHVDFTAVAEATARHSFRLVGFTDQHHFLVGAAESLLKSLEGPPTPQSQKTLRTLQALWHPENMGTRFHYLAFSKGVVENKTLSGFRHARDAHKLLFG